MPSAGPQDEGGSLPGSLLVVDDDPGVLEMLSTLLTRQGYAVRATGNPDEAIALAAEEPPELVLLDVLMPGTDGLELARILREQAGLAAAPVIYLSALHDAESKARGFAHGGVDYLTKPFRREELLARVRTHVQLHRVRHRLQEREAELERLLGNASEEVLTSERALHRRTAELSALFDALPDAVFVKDPDGVYVDGNESFARVTGRPLAEVTGHTDHELFDASFADRLRAGDRATLQGDAPHLTEEWVRLPDGSHALLESIRTPIRDDTGAVLGIIGIARDVTARHRDQEALTGSRAELLEAQEVAGLGSWRFDLRSGQLTGSDQTYSILGLTAGVPLRPREVLDLVHPDDRDGVLAAWRAAQAQGSGEVEHRLAQDASRWLRVRMRFEQDAQGRSQRALGTIMDVTDTKLRELERDAEQHRLNDALAAARAATYEWEVTSGVITVSQRWQELLAYDPQRDGPLSAGTFLNWIHPDQTAMFRAALQQILEGKEDQHELEFRVQRRDGRWLWVRGISRPSEHDADGEVVRVSGLIVDITHEKAHREQLSFVAEHDGLTGLINRQRFSEHLREELLTERGPQERLAVVSLDLDSFEAVNATHGRAAGNQLLVEIATRLLRTVGDRHRVARTGGDEFAVAVPVAADQDGWRRAVEELYDTVTRPITLQGRQVQATASIGVTLFPQARDSDAEQLLRQADQAVYQAKLAGKDRYHLFDTEHDATSRERYRLIDEIYTAIAEDQFVLHYQPQVNMRTGEIVGLEALIRWQHPERGLLPPGAFIAQLAGHPVSIEIGDWVIEAALAQLARWKDAGFDTAVSVNIDTSQLYDPHFGPRLERQLADHPSIAPTQFGIEILETGALEDLDRVAELVDDLRAMGSSVALDDFGTGFSSLTLLKRLHADFIKIDRSFVMELLEDREHALIIDSVVALSRNFGRSVLAEGVETEAHGVLLLELGCDLAQGFGIARPMPAEQVTEWVDRWQPPASWRGVEPLAADRLPALLASIEHRVWVKNLQAHLEGSGTTPPPLDPTRCRLGSWLARMEDQAGRQPPEELRVHHRALHDAASELVAATSEGATAAATAGDLAAVERASEALLAVLERWRHE